MENPTYDAFKFLIKQLRGYIVDEMHYTNSSNRNEILFHNLQKHREKDQLISSKDQLILDRDDQIHDKDDQIREKDDQMRDKD